MAMCVGVFFAGWYSHGVLHFLALSLQYYYFQFLTTIWYMSVVYRDFTFPKAFRCVTLAMECFVCSV